VKCGTECCSPKARARLDYVAYRNEPGSGNLPASQDLGVPFRDAAATHDGKIKHESTPLWCVFASSPMARDA